MAKVCRGNPGPTSQPKLEIPLRYLLAVDHTRLQRNLIEWESASGVCLSLPDLKFSPLQITCWTPKAGDTLKNSNEIQQQVLLTSELGDTLKNSNEIQQQALDLLLTNEPFQLTLAAGTPNEVIYPKVLLTTIRPNVGSAVKMDFRIFAVPHARKIGKNLKWPCIIPLTKEPNMKIYEAVIVKLDEKDEAAEVVKVIAPFVAKNDRIAQDQVLIDYAKEAGLTGKDLAGYQVRVRTFQSIA